MFLFLLLLLFFRQASSKLCLFHDGFRTKQQHLHRAVILSLKALQLVTEELWLRLWCHFLHVYACTQITQRNVIITQDCWIWNTVGVHGVFGESLVWSMILQPILHTSTEEACEDGLLLCDRWQTSSRCTARTWQCSVSCQPLLYCGQWGFLPVAVDLSTWDQHPLPDVGCWWDKDQHHADIPDLPSQYRDLYIYMPRQLQWAICQHFHCCSTQS